MCGNAYYQRILYIHNIIEKWEWEFVFGTRRVVIWGWECEIWLNSMKLIVYIYMYVWWFRCFRWISGMYWRHHTCIFRISLCGGGAPLIENIVSTPGSSMYHMFSNQLATQMSQQPAPIILHSLMIYRIYKNKSTGISLRKIILFYAF